MKYIFNRAQTIGFLYSAELLEWLQENYPYSKYHAVELEE